MPVRTFARNLPATLSRRRFVAGMAAAGVVAGLPPAFGAGPPAAGRPVELRGTEFDLAIGAARVNFTGRERTAIAVNDCLPAPLLRWREGDTVRLRVRNALDETTSIHWHGMILPAAMDGVPGLSFDGIAPGAHYDYGFTVRQSGTYWYHSHSGLQEQLGLYGAIVIEPADGERHPAERDHVLLLSDWTDEDPQRVLAKLKKQSDYYNFNERTAVDFLRDARKDGLRRTLAERLAWARMRMSAADLADVSGYTYTHLLNGLPPAANWTGLFRPGERVRLRFINASAMTYFDVRIPGLWMTVVAADGQPVRPVRVEEFRIGNAETVDVIVTPREERAYTVFAQSMDRTAWARGTLAPRQGMEAPVPSPDPRVFLAMADVGHGDHGHAGAAGPDGHAAHARHDGHGAAGIAVLPGGVRHAAAEYGPGVDMRVDQPAMKLDDPGIGLRDNGRRVLTAADLHSAFPDPDGRDPGRTLELHLTGHMGRYVWSFDGTRFSDSGPLRFRLGERLRLVLVNDTMMEHPVHLHGMWSDLEDESGRFQVRRHTISVPPGQVRSCRITADAPGAWAFHCHLLLHMETGMFRTVLVAGGEPGGAEGPADHEARGHSAHDHSARAPSAHDQPPHEVHDAHGGHAPPRERPHGHDHDGGPRS